MHLRPENQPWSNTYNRLLLCKKYRNDLLYKKTNTDYTYLSNKTNTSSEILKICLANRNKTFSKDRDSANASNLATISQNLHFIIL